MVLKLYIYNSKEKRGCGELLNIVDRISEVKHRIFEILGKKFSPTIAVSFQKNIILLW